MYLSEVFNQVYTFLDVFGVILAGVLGGMVGREERLDIIGFMALAVMAALGGGMLRDILLQSGPPVALTSPYYLGGAFTGALIAYMLPFSGRRWNRFFIVGDAFVVGTWAATGAIKTLDAGFAPVPAMLLGVITGVGGGMIRDIAVGRRPLIFGGNTLYATGALVATFPAIILWYFDRKTLALICGMLVGGFLCSLARYFKWYLPANNDYSLPRQVRTRTQEFRNRHGEPKHPKKSPSRPSLRLQLRKGMPRKRPPHSRHSSDS